MIKNIYYKIWVDAIVYEKAKNEGSRNWKTYTLIPISVLQGTNLLTIFFWLSSFDIKIDIFFDIDIFPGQMIDKFISSFISLFMPFLVINYIFIFKEKKYIELIKKYKHHNGKLYLIYFIITFAVFILPIVIAKWLI